MKQLSFSCVCSLLVFSTLTFGQTKKVVSANQAQNFQYEVEQFADIKVLRYQVPAWNKLTLKEKQLVYYLTQAGTCGRDIMWDQNYRHNLKIRKALENIYTKYQGNKNAPEWKNFVVYLKRVWFSNGIHHHYSSDKIRPDFPKAYFVQLLAATKTTLSPEIVDILFNDVDNKKVNLDQERGLLSGSAVNFYQPGITVSEVEEYYKSQSQDAKRPVSLGLNSKLIKNEDGKLEEKVWKVGGMYSPAIKRIIYWLQQAIEVAENEKQANALRLLVEFYNTGDLKIWDDYNIAWLQATEGNIDYINGFIEVYNDPLGYRGSYEGVVQIKDFDMSAKMEVISNNAQWFEDNSSIDKEYKRDRVVGVSYKTVIVAGESGDSSPSTPIGVNLPNADWIRSEYGSKSVSLGNIIESYANSSGKGKLTEFANDAEEIALAEKYGSIADKLHTALHEVIGHASGKIKDGVGTPKETLKSYASTLEEGRADLVGLYFLYHPILQDLKLVDDWKKVGMEAYDNYIRNGLMTQLLRIEPGSDIEEAHMRNRQWVSAWVFEKGRKDNVIEIVNRNGKVYYNITNYEKLRELFGELLREVQRIKSEGDYEAGKNLVENYGVKVNRELHQQVLNRSKSFSNVPYNGFVNPVYVPKYDAKGKLIDISLTQPKSFAEQMLQYSSGYSFLPLEN